MKEHVHRSVEGGMDLRAYERFLKYVVVHTTSDDTSTAVPSSQCQFDLAYLLVDEMKGMGIEDAHVDEKCYVYGTIPATPGYEEVPSLGFCAHLDTAAFNGKNVKPRVIENYDGKDVTLGDSGRTLTVEQFPHLPSMKGKTLIVTDGTTLLGGDDKAGIAEIMTLAERLMKGEIPHGKICLSFPPDEEIGAGAKDLDIGKYGATYAYTVDGSQVGLIDYENFNAALAKIHITGLGVHPGSSKNTMINALLVANELNNMLPSGETPRDTEGYEGFFHLTKLNGTPDDTDMEYIIRDHDRGLFEGRKKSLEHICVLLNDKYGDGTVKLHIRDQYYNMEEVIRQHFHLVENAIEAIHRAGLTHITRPIRGGTDGSQLSFRGLPCPNLGAGYYACHGPYEHVAAEDMDTVVEILMNLTGLYADGRE